MQLTDLLNTSNIYRFKLTDGKEIIGQLTREGKDFLQVGSQQGDRMIYRWLGITNVMLVEYLATNFREAGEILGANYS